MPLSPLSAHRRTAGAQRFGSRGARALVLFALLSASGCAQPLCAAGCSEEESDCLDAPESYDGFARCDALTGSPQQECVDVLCSDVYRRCDASCGVDEELPPYAADAAAPRHENVR